MRTLKIGLVLTATVLIFGTLAIDGEEGKNPISLSSLYRSGNLLKDRNRDDLPDGINGVIVLPSAPSPAEITAAAEMASRLGLETGELDFPISSSFDEALKGKNIPIIISPEERLISLLNLDNELARLSPGEGMVRLLRFKNKPLILIIGKDEEGLKRAARGFSFRLPYLFEPSKTKIAGVEEDILSFLKEEGIIPKSVQTVKAVYREEDELNSLSVEIILKTDEELKKANIGLRNLAIAHLAGKRDKELSFPELAQLEVILEKKGIAISIIIPRVSGAKKRDIPPAGIDNRTKEFDLSTFYSLEGIYSDTKDKTGRGGLLPEKTDVMIIFTESSPAVASGVVEIAARIGLEGTGISFPLAIHEEEIADHKRIKNPVVVGKIDSLLINELIKKAGLSIDSLKEDQGLLAVIPKGINGETTLIVSGKTDAGLKKACFQLAHNLPYLGEPELGAITLEDVEEEALRFFIADEIGGKGATAGQLASALVKLEKVPLPEQGDLLKLFLESPSPGLSEKISLLIEKRFGLKAEVEAIRRKDAKPIFEKSFEIPWEGEELINSIEDIAPELSPDEPVMIFALVSEPPEVRKNLSAKIEEILINRGLKKDGITITILNAYKPGFSWLAYQMLPKIKDYKGNIKKIVISYRQFPTIREPYQREKARKYDKELPNRFLAELHPIDDVFARELGINRDQVVFKEITGNDKTPIYRLNVFLNGERKVELGSFSPPLCPGNYFYDYPDVPKNLLPPFLSRNRFYGKTQVPTGLIEIKQGEKLILRKTIKTDLERVWDIYQQELLPEFRKLTLKVTDFPGEHKIKDKQPFFSLLRFDLSLSESDFPVYPLYADMSYSYRHLAPENPEAIRQERISSLEAISEDLYFVTLDFFKALGEELLGPGNQFTTPGLVLPVVHPGKEYLAKAGSFSVSFNINQADFPKMTIGKKEEALAGVKFRDTDLDGRKLSSRLKRPSAAALVVEENGPCHLLLKVLVDDGKKAGEMLDALSLLKKEGLFPDIFDYPGLSRIDFLIVDGKKSASRSLKIEPLSRKAARHMEVKKEQPVPLDRPIGYHESIEIMNRMAADTAVAVFPLSQSYQGRYVYGMTVTLPKEGKLRSVAKLITYKPTYFAIGRQHANEVTSTNAILRLVQLMVEDEDYHKLLNKINFIAIPIENVDGTAIHDELRKIAPLWMLHAGRYNSVGVNVSYPKFELENGRFIFTTPPRYREGLARLKLFRLFLPDLFGNNHTFPSHEWVQPFAGYAPPDFPSYLIPRALFYIIHGFLGTKKRIDDPARPGKTLEIAVADPDYPETLALSVGHREMITTALSNDCFRDPAGRTIDWWNEEFREVYKKYGKKPLPKHFEATYYNDLLVYFPEKDKSPSSRSFMARFPNITGLEWVTETADETPYGAYCELASRAHLICDEATAKMLASSYFEIKREEKEYRGGGRIRIYRKRPVVPPNIPEKPWIISGEIKLKY